MNSTVNSGSTFSSKIEVAREKSIQAAKSLAKRHAERFSSENIQDRIHWLFGGDFDWIDKVEQGRLAISAFFQMAANPKVAEQMEKIMGSTSYEWFIELLGNLPSFLEALRLEGHEAEIDVVMLENHLFGEEFSGDAVQWFLQRTEEYKRKEKSFDILYS